MFIAAINLRASLVPAILKGILTALVVQFSLVLSSHAQGDRSPGYYGVFSASGSNPRITEIVTTYYDQMTLDRPAPSLVFHPDSAVVTTYWGPYETAEAARKSAYWYEDPEWRAALVAVVGNEEEADALVEEHLSLVVDPESYLVTLRKSEAADFSGAPLGPDAGVTQAFYIERATTYTDQERTRALEIVNEYFMPALEAAGTEFFEFTGIDTGRDVTVLLGRYETLEAAEAAMQTGSSANNAFMAALAQIAGGQAEAVAINEEFSGLTAEDEFVVVWRPTANDAAN